MAVTRPESIRFYSIRPLAGELSKEELEALLQPEERHLHIPAARVQGTVTLCGIDYAAQAFQIDHLKVAPTCPDCLGVVTHALPYIELVLKPSYHLRQGLQAAARCPCFKKNCGKACLCGSCHARKALEQLGMEVPERARRRGGI